MASTIVSSFERKRRSTVALSLPRVYGSPAAETQEDEDPTRHIDSVRLSSTGSPFRNLPNMSETSPRKTAARRTAQPMDALSGPLIHAMVPPSSPATAAPKVPMKNVSRERMRAELTYLRKEVVMLEKELQMLKYHHQHGERVRRRQHPTLSNLELRERAVKQEKERLAEAERENRNLRAALSRQVKVGKSLLAVIVNPSHLASEFSTVVATDNQVSRTGNRAASPSPTNTATQGTHDQQFEWLADAVERAYMNSDAILTRIDKSGAQRDVLMTTSSVVFSRQRQDVNNACETVFEFRGGSRIMGDIARCCEVMWRATCATPRSHYVKVDTFPSSTDSKNLRIELVQVYEGKRFHLTRSVVAKRFAEANSMAVVWVATTSTMDHTASDLYVVETGWTRLSQDSTTANTEGAVRETCVQCMTRRRGDGNVSDPATSPRARALTNVVFHEVGADVAATCEYMETLLIDECMADMARATERMSM